MPDNSVALLQGSLNLLVLKTLSWQPMHGFGTEFHEEVPAIITAGRFRPH